MRDAGVGRQTQREYRKDGNSGEEIWNKLIRPSPQIFMVLCGHIGSVEEYHQISQNDAGVNVLEMLGDYQDRELVAERAQIREGTKDWDRALAGLSMLLFMPGSPIVSGLDARFGWSSASLPVQVLGGVFFAAAWILSAWAMATNKFFSVTVRIQKERGHAVITGGPYALVRHPGYLAFIVAAGATPDGRKAGRPLAEGSSPSSGTDRLGPTAVLKSVSKLPAERIVGGVLLNQKLYAHSFLRA